jgi:hypothetical protein
LICISVAARIRRLQAASQHLGMAMILLLGGFFVGVNVLEHNAIGWFTGSMIAAFLGCSAMLPLTPRRMLAVVLVMSALALVEGILSGMAPASVPFLVQSNLIAACGLISYLGNHLAFRIRRDEFYNRYQLHRANERLARLDRSR